MRCIFNEVALFGFESSRSSFFFEPTWARNVSPPTWGFLKGINHTAPEKWLQQLTLLENLASRPSNTPCLPDLTIVTGLHAARVKLIDTTSAYEKVRPGSLRNNKRGSIWNRASPALNGPISFLYLFNKLRLRSDWV